LGIKVSPRSVPLASDGANHMAEIADEESSPNSPLLDWLKTAPYPRRKPLPEKKWLEKNTGVDYRDILSVVGRDLDRTATRKEPAESGLLGVYMPTQSSRGNTVEQLDKGGWAETAYDIRDRKLDRRFPLGDFTILDRQNLENKKKRAEGMASMMGGRPGTGGYRGPSIADHEQRHRAYDVVGKPLASMLSNAGYMPTTDPRYKAMPNEVSTRLFDFINNPDQEEPAREHLKTKEGLDVDKMLNDRRILDTLAEQERRAKVYLQSHRSFNRELPKGRAQVLSERANTAYDKLQNSGLFGAIRSAFK
jgi:hypothetical protein